MIAALLLAAALPALPDGLVLANETSAYDEMVAKTAHSADASFSGQACDNIHIERVWRQTVKIADHPNFLAVRERVKVSGCGRTTLQNLQIGRVGGTPPWRMTYGLPGESLTDVQWQQSVLPRALAEAAVDVPPGCQDRRLGDIYVSTRPGHVDSRAPGAPNVPAAKDRLTLQFPAEMEADRQRFDMAGAWAEVWPISFCGQDRTLVVVIVPLKDQFATAPFFLPVWRSILAEGPGARPAPAPPE